MGSVHQRSADGFLVPASQPACSPRLPSCDGQAEPNCHLAREGDYLPEYPPPSRLKSNERCWYKFRAEMAPWLTGSAGMRVQYKNLREERSNLRSTCT